MQRAFPLALSRTDRDAACVKEIIKKQITKASLHCTAGGGKVGRGGGLRSSGSELVLLGGGRGDPLPYRLGSGGRSLQVDIWTARSDAVQSSGLTDLHVLSQLLCLPNRSPNLLVVGWYTELSFEYAGFNGMADYFWKPWELTWFGVERVGAWAWYGLSTWALILFSWAF